MQFSGTPRAVTPRVTTRLVNLVADAADPAASAHWRAEALGWEVTFQTRHEVAVEPAAGTPGLPLVFVPVPDHKSVPNRVHLDLASPSTEARATLVDRLLGLGATPADVGQGQVPRVVLADPEGNELCVLEPRDQYRGTGPLAAVVMAAADPPALARFLGRGRCLARDRRRRWARGPPRPVRPARS